MSNRSFHEHLPYMAACLRLARRHRGQTGTNPSVGTLLVDALGRIVAKGITAQGGRPHAEPIALVSAGPLASGTTAYVTLEPCAHHGVTPPCAEALIAAGVSHVVTAWTDPDSRVDGKGHHMLREAGIEVETGILAAQAEQDLASYLSRKKQHRPHVTLKLAVSADGFLGVEGEETPITGSLARNYVHRMRAESDLILIGSGTARSDDPELTCRLPGLSHRSPMRLVLDRAVSLSSTSRLALTAREVSTALVTDMPTLPDDLIRAGVKRIGAEIHDGRIALPELLEDLASAGHSSLMVEGGATVARSFLEHDLVDCLALFTGAVRLGGRGNLIASPITMESVPEKFRLEKQLVLLGDRLDIYRRSG